MGRRERMERRKKLKDEIKKQIRDIKEESKKYIEKMSEKYGYDINKYMDISMEIENRINKDKGLFCKYTISGGVILEEKKLLFSLYTKNFKTVEEHSISIDENKTKEDYFTEVEKWFFNDITDRSFISKLLH